MAKDIDDLNAAVSELETAVALLKEQAAGGIAPAEVQAVTERVKALTASITNPPAPTE